MGASSQISQFSRKSEHLLEFVTDFRESRTGHIT